MQEQVLRKNDLQQIISPSYTAGSQIHTSPWRGYLMKGVVSMQIIPVIGWRPKSLTWLTNRIRTPKRALVY